MTCKFMKCSLVVCVSVIVAMGYETKKEAVKGEIEVFRKGGG